MPAAKPTRAADSVTAPDSSASARTQRGYAAAPSTAEHRTVARVMAILELVLASETSGMRLGELSTAINAPKSSVHGLAKGLVATGYFREERGKYFAGPAISSLIAVGPSALPSMYHHALEQLAAEWNETASLATLVGDSVVYLDSAQPDVLVRAVTVLNKRVPLWPRSSGKCFLAFMEPKRLEAYLRRHHPTQADADRVRDELARVREQRVALNLGETVRDNIGIASPIIIEEAPVTVAIAIAGPRSRMQDHIAEITTSVRETAASLSSDLRLE